MLGTLVRRPLDRHLSLMRGRVIQSSGPLRYAIVDGMSVRDSRVQNYPPRWNAAPSQELLVIRQNHRTGEVSLDPLRWGLIPHWCKDPDRDGLEDRWNPSIQHDQEQTIPIRELNATVHPPLKHNQLMSERRVLCRKSVL
jgi:putative SOS response-associated peptidase YedK